MTSELPIDDPRSAILQQVRDERKQQSQDAHEANVLRRVLARLAPGYSVPALKARIGMTPPSLAMLPDILANMPLRLAAEAVPYLGQITPTQLLGGELKGTALWNAYHRRAEQLFIDPLKTAFGLVTPWIGATTVVLHNWPRYEETLDKVKPYGRFVMVVRPRGGATQLYSLEPLESLLSALESAGVCPI